MTLDEDVAEQVTRLMHERRAGFKETVNELLRRGLRSAETVVPYTPPRFRSGVRAGVDLDKALAIAGQLEDDEFVRRYESGT